MMEINIYGEGPESSSKVFNFIKSIGVKSRMCRFENFRNVFEHSESDVHIIIWDQALNSDSDIVQLLEFASRHKTKDTLLVVIRVGNFNLAFDNSPNVIVLDINQLDGVVAHLREYRRRPRSRQSGCHLDSPGVRKDRKYRLRPQSPWRPSTGQCQFA